MTTWLRRGAGLLLLLDGAGAAMGLAAILPFMAAHGSTVIATVLARAAAGGVELIGGLWLFQDRPAAERVARAGALLAAVTGTLAVGLRLAPSSLDPSLRMPVVIGYWLFAVVVIALTRGRTVP